MKNLSYTTSTLSNDADGICASQSAAGAGALTLDGALVSGGIATIAEAQKVTVTSAGNDSGITFTVAGKDADGVTISDTFAGGNTTTASSTYYFKSVTGVSASAATASTVTVGPLSTNGAVSKSLRLNSKAENFKVGLFADVTGTLTYSVEYAYEQPEDSYSVSYSSSADWRVVDGLSAQTTDQQSNLAYPVNAVRLKITSYTSGSVKLTATQGYGS